MTRRQVLAVGAAGLLAVRPGVAGGQEVVKDIRDLKPGEFTWHPERQPAGPVAVVVSIPEQRVHVYRNGIRIAVSTCSTGKKGHETPTGVFTVLEKDRRHRSSTYSNAPMPNMNRLTWSGIALHAGNLPGYPASHGCVRLPLAFSEKLFGITHVGTPVIIAGAHTDPWELTHPGLVLAGTGDAELEAAVDGLAGKTHPADWSEAESQPITTVLVSSADRTVILLENERVVATAPLLLDGSPTLGSHVLMLRSAHDGGLVWQGLSHRPDPGDPTRPEETLLQRIKAGQSFIAVLQEHMHPGMVLVVTDLPTRPESRSGQDFVILSDS